MGPPWSRNGIGTIERYARGRQQMRSRQPMRPRSRLGRAGRRCDASSVRTQAPAGAAHDAAPGVSGWGLAAVCVGIAASVIPGFLLGSLFVSMGPELGYDEATSGLLVAAFFCASAFLSAP